MLRQREIPHGHTRGWEWWQKDGNRGCGAGMAVGIDVGFGSECFVFHFV